MHTQINLQSAVPKLVWFTSARTHDKRFLEHLKLEKGKIAVFEKGTTITKPLMPLLKTAYSLLRDKRPMRCMKQSKKIPYLTT